MVRGQWANLARMYLHVLTIWLGLGFGFGLELLSCNY